MRSHSISLEVLDGGAGGTKKSCGRVNMMIKAKKMVIKNKNIRAAVETSPARRSILKSFFYARDKMAEANPSTSWTTCSRALGVWDITQSRKLGWFQRDIDRWIWNKKAIAAAGLRDLGFDHFHRSEENEKDDDAVTPDGQPEQAAAQERYAAIRRLEEMEPPKTKVARALKATTSAALAPTTIVAATSSSSSTARPTAAATTMTDAPQPEAMECEKDDGEL